LGSIGASGDLVPLGAIAGALVGIDPSFKVDVGGHSVGLRDMEKRFGLSPLSLGPKEGLALVNGISASAGIACNVLYDARSAFALTIATHGLMIEALEGSHQSFNPFVHQQKQHLGQKWVAEKIMDRLKNYDVRSAKSDHIQDRYSIRCLPQFLGPMAEGLGEIGRKLEVEINSVADNPLIDVENESFFHGGNFLGQYISEGMDRLRHYLGLAAKHMDAQIAVLVEPAYSNGLPASLIGNDESAVNMGLKGLQISANSIAPLLAFYGQPLADRFPTHAEQGNQNINSLSYSAACLAKKSIGLCQNHLAISLIFAVQALDLRCYKLHGHYDAQILLSEPAYKLYLAVHAVVCKPVNVECAFINNNDEQALDEYIKAIVKNIIEGGDILQSVSDIRLGHIQNF
jgi:phenylalanine ammonia-lyase